MFLIYVIYFQHWLNPASEEIGSDYLTFITETKKPATERTVIDEIQIVLVAQMLGRNVTILAPDQVWCSDAAMAHDIIIIYSGTPVKQFYPLQVGN